MSKIKKLISGGQSGVDRAALDFAIDHHIGYGGWCPNKGWAEDFQEPPGLLKIYNNLVETPSVDTKQRTKRNVRDSNATIIIYDSSVDSVSEGTNLTVDTAIKLKKPFFEINIDDSINKERFFYWLSSIKDNNIIVNIAGPRESESPGIYIKTINILNKLFAEAGHKL